RRRRPAAADAAERDDRSVPDVAVRRPELLDQSFDDSIAVPHERFDDVISYAGVAEEAGERRDHVIAVEPAEHPYERTEFVATGDGNGLNERALRRHGRVLADTIDNARPVLEFALEAVVDANHRGGDRRGARG